MEEIHVFKQFGNCFTYLLLCTNNIANSIVSLLQVAFWIFFVQLKESAERFGINIVAYNVLYKKPPTAHKHEINGNSRLWTQIPW